jgi:hypothetical protein
MSSVFLARYVGMSGGVRLQTLGGAIEGQTNIGEGGETFQLNINVINVHV